jgi:hypothetical protein
MPQLNKYLQVILESKLETKSDFRLFMVYIIALTWFWFGVSAIFLKAIYPILYLISFIPLWICITIIGVSFGIIIHLYEHYYKKNEEKIEEKITEKDTSNEDRDWG